MSLKEKKRDHRWNLLHPRSRNTDKVAQTKFMMKEHNIKALGENIDIEECRNITRLISSGIYQ